MKRESTERVSRKLINNQFHLVGGARKGNELAWRSKVDVAEGRNDGAAPFSAV